MNILYFGKYKKRFIPILEEIKKGPQDSRILELCFGDIYIAEYCKALGFRWKGIDINGHFVEHAKKFGHDAYLEDIAELKVLPTADICIMIGSLYHFYSGANLLLAKMFKASDILIISEPISNISSLSGLVGFFAKRLASVGKGNEEFRYNKSSLMNFFQENSKILNYRIEIVQNHGKDLVVKLLKNGKN